VGEELGTSVLKDVISTVSSIGFVPFLDKTTPTGMATIIATKSDMHILNYE
jgi:hypothetical protein